MSCRSSEPGWVLIDQPDSRRGVWVRPCDGGLEVCAGREGDDAYVRLGGTVTPEQVEGLRAVLMSYAWSWTVAGERSPPVSALGDLTDAADDLARWPEHDGGAPEMAEAIRAAAAVLAQALGMLPGTG